ncbi:FAD-dependent oxidoreductase [Spartinivicinus poritis]|uniref:FAD-dependent oxidoreductase n=1 Tax=Spartinivicinus poritis TaxID=2994640 RepID=A0ABT5U6D3_9GAMM|nr:FAD-dependent oxidoreductase [Spartinivicinus sp. A2-2]MDE1461918.1 FAD-dependent oxidoreductase [Spartinivicinus sp. A2-2]
MIDSIKTDIVIVGGGIAGLWLANRLQQLGYNCLILEKGSFGGGQTVKSQGIIHGGTKYTLTGTLTKSAEAISQMPSRWRQCLAGEGEIDLTSVKVLSQHHYMWSTQGLGSKLTTFFASKALRGRVNKLSKKEYPTVFQNPAFKGDLYQLDEVVLDVPSVIQALVKPIQQSAVQLTDNAEIDWQVNEQGTLNKVVINDQNQRLTVSAQHFVLTTGEGTQDILNQLNFATPQMQLRPLHMVMIKHPHPHPIYAHCIGAQALPKMTITSHPTTDGQWVWYLGGAIAENGLDKSTEEQIATAKQQIQQLLPWVDFSQTQWATFRVNRAEPKQNSLVRPDAAYCQTQNNVSVCWPTKLALAPDLADQIIKQLSQLNIQPNTTQAVLPDWLNPPIVSAPFWQEYFDEQI